MIIARKERDIVSQQWRTVDFERTYSTPPLVLITPVTDNNGNNYPIPQIRNVTTNSFELTVCVDEGDIFCSTMVNSEDVHYFVIDRDLVDQLSWIDAGVVSVASDGSDTSVVFNKTFANNPYVFTTSQTSNQ